MKSKLIAASAMAVLSLGLSGCVISVGDHESDKGHDYWEKQQDRNRSLLNSLSLGMTSEQVQTLMGTADFSEAYSKTNATNNEQAIKVLFYRTQWAKGDGKTTKDECTPVVFKDNTLIGWGDTALQQI
ncbi:DUF3192 domain-containing protein [Shewanella ulleungensis]|jgi:hypothetical protein|uniref:DUF3192 domain-containing protein n=1 Tax=Shewanella ulleungensis TaxID=2282699 RepID=A0ABQ2QXJ4_9GAMM|nr:DUF3192 domain-containing protein [Shewanella ulleungensis]MCL1151500.1 DUF3192 domain-containing protein [Shewanella ulleungensis]GGQ01121.1 hypothetical protein GCM10009410_38400 [Shewanella ulleungensis]